MEELLETETQLRGKHVNNNNNNNNISLLFGCATGIDCEAARSQEERQMLADTSRWLEGDPASARLLQPHPRTGATPLHVAAAKGYIRVMSMLVQGGGDLNTQDIDGWTPLHAAAHWGQREACQLLCENMADMEVRNYVVRQKIKEIFIVYNFSKLIFRGKKMTGSDVFRCGRSGYHPAVGRMQETSGHHSTRTARSVQQSRQCTSPVTYEKSV